MNLITYENRWINIQQTHLRKSNFLLRYLKKYKKFKNFRSNAIIPSLNKIFNFLFFFEIFFLAGIKKFTNPIL